MSGRKRKWDLDDKGEVHDVEEKKPAGVKTEGLTEKNGNEADAIEAAKEAANRINALLYSKGATVGESKENKEEQEEEEEEKKKEREKQRTKTGEEHVPFGEESKAGPEPEPPKTTPTPTPEATPSSSLASTLGIDLQDGGNKEKDKALLEAKFKQQVDINDHRHRYYLCREQTIAEVESHSGAVLLVRGKYYPDRSLADPKKDPPPLHLEISASTQESLDKALRRINELKETGPPIVSRTHPQLFAKVMAPFDATAVPGSFNFRAKILGPQGSFLRHIQNETGVKAHLRGKRSGHIEIGQREDQLEPLHILLQSDRQTSIDEAKKLAEDLLATVKSELDVFMAPPPPALPPVSAPPYGYPAMYAPTGYATTGYANYYPPLMYPSNMMYHHHPSYAPAPAMPPQPSLPPNPPPLADQELGNYNVSPGEQDASPKDYDSSPKDYSNMPPPPGLYK